MKPNIFWINAEGRLVEGTSDSFNKEMQSPNYEKPDAAEKSWPAMAQMLKFIQTLNSASILRINSITPSQKN